MIYKSLRTIMAFLAVVFWLCSATAWGQTQEFYVASTGTDNSACSRSSPCRTFAGAITVANNYPSQINVLDSAEYGPVVITKNTSIVADGVIATLTATGSNDILIQASNALVTLRGLTLIGIPNNGSGGLVVFGGSNIEVDDCVISGFSTGVELSTRNQTARVHLYHTKIIQNQIGVNIIPGTQPNGVVIDDSSIDYNQTANILINGSNAAVLVGNSSIQGGPALVVQSGQPSIQSYGDNRISASFPASIVQRQ